MKKIETKAEVDAYFDAEFKRLEDGEQRLFKAQAAVKRQREVLEYTLLQALKKLHRAQAKALPAIVANLLKEAK